MMLNAIYYKSIVIQIFFSIIDFKQLECYLSGHASRGDSFPRFILSTMNNHKNTEYSSSFEK